MSMLQKKGTYLAFLGNTSLEEKEKGTVFFNAFCKCTHERAGGDFAPVSGDQNIIARLNLVKTDGNLNEINISSLKAALGWDGASFASLQREDWGDLQVQVVVEEVVYDGKTSLKVQYMNPKDYKGSGAGIKALEQQVVQSLDSKYGAMLRALSVAKPGNGNGASKTTSSPSNTGAVGKDLAWQALINKCDEYSREHPEDAYDQNRKIAKFKEIVAATVPGKSGTQISPNDWAIIKSAIEKDFLPALGDLCPI